MSFWATVLAVITGVSTVIVFLFLVKKLIQWLRPVRITPEVFISFIDTKSDQLRVTVTNTGIGPIYITKCRGRDANRISYILRTFIRHPFIKPSLYNNVLFGAHIYEMIDSDPICLNEREPVTLTYTMTFDEPIFAFSCPMVLVEVHLSDGRVFRSRRQEIPNHWRYFSQREKGMKNE